MKKFKVGDWVTVKKSLKVWGHYGVYFNPLMKKYRGKTFKINGVYDDHISHLEGCKDVGGHWNFSPEMLKPALNPEIKAAFKALKKLARLVKPVGTTEPFYHVIRTRLNENWIIITVSKTPTLLSFETLKKAEKFRKKHADLLEIAKPLL